MSPVRSTRLVPAGNCNRAGFSSRGLLFVLPLVLAVPLVVWLVPTQVGWSSQDGGPLMYEVQRGNFVHEITEGGEIESASNVEIRCEVKARNQAGTTILWIVPEGTYVQPDNELVKLDSSSLENELTQQQIVCNNSKAAVTKAQNDYDNAVIAEQEYLQGQYILAQNNIEKQKFTASQSERQAQQRLEYSKGLYKKGYVTKLTVEEHEISLKKAELDRRSAELELDVLEKFTKQKKLNELKSAIETADARLASEKASHKLDEEKRKLVESQVAKCTIRAPQSGQVVYANETNRRGGAEIIIEPGAMVRENQVIIRLPDPKRMQVKAKINEAKVTLVEEGMPAKIRLNAFPDLELGGTVEKINEYPAPSAWWAGNIKEYETFIKILNPPSTMKPGLTAEVKIHVEDLPDVVQVPVQAIFEHGDHRHYCVKPDGKSWKAHEVQIGSTNDKFVVIRNGLEPGEQVVLGAAAYRDKVDLPEPPPEAEASPIVAQRRPAVERKQRPEREEKKTGRPKQDRPNPAAMAGTMIQQFDKNNDGRLQQDELPQQMRPHFAQADTNGDGAVDRTELAAVLAKMAGRGRGGKPRGDGKPSPGAGP